MLTEYQALYTAKEHVEKALDVLEEFPGGSYAADEAYEDLGKALGALMSGLRYFATEDGPEQRGEAPGSLEETQGEGEGGPDPHPYTPCEIEGWL